MNRHTHRFVPEGGSTGNSGKDDRKEQYCECGARRCAAESSMGFFSVHRRCRMFARPGERTCARHSDKPPLYTMTLKQHSDFEHERLMKSVGRTS
jgi:hypothetical protein